MSKNVKIFYAPPDEALIYVQNMLDLGEAMAEKNLRSRTPEEPFILEYMLEGLRELNTLVPCQIGVPGSVFPNRKYKTTFVLILSIFEEGSINVKYLLTI